jgi:hypothetical protein
MSYMIASTVALLGSGPYLVSLIICSVFHYAFPWLPGSNIWQGLASTVVDTLF